ncbi:MAG: DUF1775 domain-containing protein [Neisseriaceae bacterium]|nr:DUF1775 domain-containing protein [Neisseriaceae bacterium]MBP6862777.1 DUF1775 domain-containing protein [Neisseriaceae bacterium]
MKTIVPALFGVLSLLAVTPAWSHAQLSPKDVSPGYAGPMQVQIGHGCGEEATESITLFVPSSVVAVPQDKLGWLVSSLERDGQVSEIRWFGNQLPSAESGAFVFDIVAPMTPGAVSMVVRQECASAVQVWQDQAPQSAFPIPSFTVGGAGMTMGMDGMEGMNH